MFKIGENARVQTCLWSESTLDVWDAPEFQCLWLVDNMFEELYILCTCTLEQFFWIMNWYVIFILMQQIGARKEHVLLYLLVKLLKLVICWIHETSHNITLKQTGEHLCPNRIFYLGTSHWFNTTNKTDARSERCKESLALFHIHVCTVILK